MVRVQVCGGQVGQGPSWLGAELVRGRDVQFFFRMITQCIKDMTCI